MRKPRFWSRVALFVLVVAVWPLAHHSGQIALALLFGWAGFLWRVLPVVSLRWDGVAMFFIGLAAAAAVAHYLLRWIYPATRDAAQPSAGRWQFRWTLVLLAFVILIFTAGISIVGATHELVWLLNSREPLFGEYLPQTNGDSSTMHLRHISLGMANRYGVYKSFPTRWRTSSNVADHSWATQILPYLWYTSPIDLQRRWDDPANLPHFRAVVPAYINPELQPAQFRDANGLGLNHYAGNTHIFDRTDRLRLEDIRQPAASTLMIGEVNTGFVPWGQPANSRDPREAMNSAAGFGGAQSQGANFVLLDGSVRFIRRDIAPRVLESMSTLGGVEQQTQADRNHPIDP